MRAVAPSVKSARVTRILITNDDGIRAPGLAALARMAARWGDPLIVAPDRDKSGIGHAITLKEPLRAHRLSAGALPCEAWEVVNGSPTDCVYLGLHHVLAGERPALVLSGINPGPNLGWDAFYSGTVAGAREGALQGVPGVAFSLLSGPELPFDELGPIVDHVIEYALATPLPPWVCLNVNVPNPRIGPIRGIRGTCLGQRHYSKEIHVRQDPRGGEYLWIGGKDVFMPDLPGSDCNAVREGFVAVTPLGCDLTHPAALANLATIESTL